MRKTWTEIKNATMTPERQIRIHKLAMKDVAKIELRQLREAFQVTQVELSKKLKTTQAAISRLEKNPNMMVDTLRSYVEALGGELELRAVMSDRTVRLTQFPSGSSKTVAIAAKRGGASISRKRASKTRARAHA